MFKIQDIRQKIIDREYYLSSHAEEEMVDDNLERDDVENAILKGRILPLTVFVAKMDSHARRQKRANFRANCHDKQTH